MDHANTDSHYVIMFGVMLASGMLSSMNVYANKPSDVRYSLNDLYMTLLMTGWMFLLMGLFYSNMKIALIGLWFVGFSIWAIRVQLFIGKNSYFNAMIPHHSMAIQMSQQLMNKGVDDETNKFLENIIKAQGDEIKYMKSKLNQ